MKSVNSLSFASASESERMEARAALYCLRLLLANKGGLRLLMMRSADDCAATFGRFLPWTQTTINKIRSLMDEEEAAELARFQHALLTGTPFNKEEFNPELSEAMIRHLAKADMSSLQCLMARSLKQLELQASQIEVPFHNITLLGKALALNQIELKLLDYACLIAQFCPLSVVLNHLGAMDFNSYCRMLDVMLKETDSNISHALRQKSTLRTCGIISVRRGLRDLEDFVGLEDNGQLLLREQFDDVPSLMAQLIRPSKTGTLHLSDYAHMDESVDGLLTYLRETAANKNLGTNILLYGRPGTGKTELAKLVATELGWQAYDIAHTDAGGDAIEDCDRFGRYAMAQKFLGAQSQAILIFDEVEDVFPSNNAGLFDALFGVRSHGKAAAGKAWINELLESTSVPAIWIANEIRQIDPAYLRRFQIVLEVPNPPLSARIKMVKHELDGVIDDESLIEEIAQDASLTPAVLNTVTLYARTVAGKQADKLADTLRAAITQRKQAMGLTDTPSVLRQHPTKVSLEYLNLAGKVPIEKIVNCLVRQPQGSLCLYGPPGTGKTTLAEYIAKTLGKPLLIKRASDLLDKYVGESEKHIRAMFNEARTEKAVLLLDEADSFLRSRKSAEHRWEASQTNELLQQMERFEGIFICTTNLFEEMDEAALRRFSHKLRFDYLRPAQRETLFAQEAMEGRDELLPAWGRRLAKLETLTPGDFAVVKQQQKLYGERFLPEDFLVQLEEECAIKRGKQSAHIGFLG